MFDNLKNASVIDATEEDVMAAMGGEPNPKTKGKEKPAEKTDKTDKSDKSKTAPATQKTDVVTDMGDTDLNKAFPGDDDDDDKPKDDDDEPKDDEPKDDDDEPKEDDSTDELIAPFLKARVELLLKKGEWKTFEFDGKKPEDIEWTEEIFEEIELQQRAWGKEEVREEILETFGPYGRDIAEYSANGGDPEELIDIFKEQQHIKAIDISTEDGQKEMVFQYQTEILKRSPARANKEIERLIADKMLEDDAKEAKDMIESHLKDQSDAMKQAQEDARKEHENKIKATQTKFVADVADVLDKADDISDDEKKDIKKLLTTFKHELPNGTKVNDFYFKLADFRKDLRNYIDMVRFVNNPKSFRKNLKNEGKTEEAEKGFKIARGAQSKKSVKSSQEPDDNRSPKKGSGFRLL